MKKIIACIVAASLVTACSTEAPNGAENPVPSGTTSEAQFPRTVTVDGAEVTVPARPERIAVLTPDLTSLVLPLAGSERVVMAAELNPELGKVAEQANALPNVLKVGAPVDPEQVMKVNPDLVLISARHGAEKDAIEMLKASGLPLGVVSSDSWSSIDDILAHVDQVAQLVGEDTAGDEWKSQIEAKRAAVEIKTLGQPTVLTMMSRGGKNLIMPKTTMLNGLVREAGGKPIVDSMDAPGSIPADPEAIVKAAPEIIIIQNYRGKGADDFKPLLDNPALAQVPAVKNQRVYFADTSTTGVTSAAAVTDGLQQVADFLSES